MERRNFLGLAALGGVATALATLADRGLPTGEGWRCD